MSHHYLILNRWVGDYAEYESYVDHSNNIVTYIASRDGVRGVPQAATAVRVVEATDNFEQVLDASAALVAEYGPPTFVVALYEDDTICGARLRELYDCAGPRVNDLIRFRDKRMQADAMSHAGVRAPKYCSVHSWRDVQQFGDQIGYPVVIKPTRASSCKGVQVIQSAADARMVELDRSYRYIAQEFIDYPIYHVDGLYSDGRLIRVGANRHFNTCIGFQNGGYLGSLEVDDSPLRRAIVRFTGSVLKAMCSSSETVTFHLELFVDHNAMPDDACTFLEIAARVGGGGIPFVWREVYNCDIMRMQFELSCGRDVGSVSMAEPSARAGWVLMQLPHKRPCVIDSVTSLIGMEMGPYAEVIPHPGEIIHLTDTFFEHVAGRFRFRGGNYTELFDQMMAIVDAFKIEATPVVESLVGS